MTLSHLHGKKRSKALKAKHRELIADMSAKSHTLNQIAAAVKLSVPTVKRELRKLAAEWKRNAAETIDTHRQLELAKLELIEQQAWDEFERSRGDYWKETTERMKVPGKVKNVEDFETDAKVIKRETGGRLADPRYLQIALSAHERRAKLLGLDAPTKVAPTDPTGEKPYQPEKMTDAEIDARIAELTAKAA